VLLAIDTSTNNISLALVQDDCLLAELTWLCGQNHSVELLPRLTHLLAQAKLDIKSLSGVVVATGPGSFNGLRVGVTTAKGFAFSLNIPVVGISTLEITAYQHAETGLPVCPVLNAGRSEVAVALFQMKDGEWLMLSAEHITTVEAICAEIHQKTVFCGEHVPFIATQLRGTLGEKAVLPPRSAQVRRAGFLAELGHRRLEIGKYDNPATLQPLYLRRPSITTPKRRITILGGEKDDKFTPNTR
jgi:tRNA threonylcarbamoyl adenosine modification protein YeaZ